MSHLTCRKVKRRTNRKAVFEAGSVAAVPDDISIWVGGTTELGVDEDANALVVQFEPSDRYGCCVHCRVRAKVGKL